MKVLLIIIIAIFLSSLTSFAQNIELTIKGIRSSRGQILIGVFKDNETFYQEKPYKGFEFSKNNVVNETLTVKFDLEPGTLGLSIVDDENNNYKMDYNMLKIPKEGFGFSNYYHKPLSKPHFDMFKFEVKERKQKVEVLIKYL